MAVPQRSAEERKAPLFLLMSYVFDLARRHHGVLCYTAGCIAVLLLPMLAKNTYISENALMPGSGYAGFGNLETLDARASALEIRTLVSQERDGRRAVSKWLVQRMAALGADCYVHPLSPPTSAFLSTTFPTPSDHFKWIPSNQSSHVEPEQQIFASVNVVGIIRAPQAEGNEAIVLVTPFDVEQFGQESALTLGLGLALFARLSQALWLARDIVWLIPDSNYGVYSAVAGWLKEYHEPKVKGLSIHEKKKLALMTQFLLKDLQFSRQEVDDLTIGDFKRAGTIATGLVFELKADSSVPSNAVTLWAEGPNGQMPNLDFVNIVSSIAAWREGLQVRLEGLPIVKSWPWLRNIDVMLGKFTSLAKKLSPNSKFASPAAVYSENFAILLNSMFFQVVGLPTGAHGAFRDYQIDALTLKFPSSENIPDYLVSKFGRLLEGVLRSVNNLLEKWHQSFFLYFLSCPNKYISVGVYMIPFALLLLSLPLSAAALCYPLEWDNEVGKVPKEDPVVITGTKVGRKVDMENKELPISTGVIMGDVSRNWLLALASVGAVQLWGFFVAFTLYLICQMKARAELKLFGWLVLLITSLFVALSVCRYLSNSFYASNRIENLKDELSQSWVAVKSVTLGFTTIGLAVMSTINYPVALVGTLLLVPMCLGVLPLRYIRQYVHNQSPTGILALGAGTMWTLIVSPLGVAVLARAFYGHLFEFSPSNLWNLLEGLLEWRSALLPYVLLIHGPCAVLCVTILFSTQIK